MKRIAIFFTLVLVLAGCQLDNPLTGNTDQPLGTGAGNLPKVVAVVPQNRGLLPDDNPDKPGIQGTVEVTFSDYMDEAGLTSANLTVLNTATGEEVQGLEIGYLPEARKLFVRSEEWPAGSEFLLTLATPGVKNSYGTVLDGNGNGRDDGAPYDDFLTTFYVSGGNPANCVPTKRPIVQSISPDTVRITQFRPQIRIQFSGPMDTLTLKTADGKPQNIQLASEQGNAVPLDLVTASRWELAVVPKESLLMGRRYVVTLASGNIRADYPTHTPDYLRALDPLGDGAQATEPDLVWYFALDTLVPPRVADVNGITDGIEIEFTTLMDTATLNSATVQVYDGNGFVPGRLRLYRTAGGITVVDYYFSRQVAGGLRVFVSHLVSSNQGLLLDSNGNGIGGEVTDDYNERL
ncbi:MAG: membrane lipoprotein lipid attachment site-containing protein [candidate division WOR-3 bacterium]